MSSSSRPPLRTFAALALCGAGFAVGGAARGADLRMTVEKPRFTCERGGSALSHVAFHPERQRAAGAVLPTALPCCDGQLGCAQFLSTNTVVLPSRRWHS